MANNTKKKTTAAKAVVNENTVVAEGATVVTESIVETPVVKAPVVKKHSAEDGIPCKSITPGGLYMEGIKSHILYEWADVNDVTEVEYQDLVAAIRSNNNAYINKPYFIIEDETVIEEFPKINKIYESMYSTKDLKDVLLDLSAREMKSAINAFPAGAKESIKHIASQMISNGSLDSLQKIKILDEIFDTKFMVMAEMFNDK